MRPDTYLEGLRYPLAVILLCFCIKTCSNRFAALTYQLQQAWWKALLKAASVTANYPPARLKTLILEFSFRSFFRDVLLL